MENFVFAMKGTILPRPHFRRATASTTEPLAALYSVSTSTAKAKVSHRFTITRFSCSNTALSWCVEPHTAGQMLLLPGN